MKNIFQIKYIDQKYASYTGVILATSYKKASHDTTRKCYY